MALKKWQTKNPKFQIYLGRQVLYVYIERLQWAFWWKYNAYQWHLKRSRGLPLIEIFWWWYSLTICHNLISCLDGFYSCIVYSFMHSSIRPSVHPSIHPSIYLFIYLCTCVFIYLSIYSFIHSLWHCFSLFICMSFNYVVNIARIRYKTKIKCSSVPEGGDFLVLFLLRRRGSSLPTLAHARSLAACLRTSFIGLLPAAFYSCHSESMRKLTEPQSNKTGTLCRQIVERGSKHTVFCYWNPRIKISRTV